MSLLPSTTSVPSRTAARTRKAKTRVGGATLGRKYEFKDVDGGTELVIDVDTPEEMEAFMQETWPKALRRLKATCEARA